MGTRWSGVLAPINQPTGDGRRMAVGAFTNRPLPLPLRWQRPETQGHDDAVVVGSIDNIRIDNEAGHVWGEGELFDDVSPATSPQLAEDVASAKYLLTKKVIGPSVDPGHASAVAVIAGTDQPLTEEKIFELMLAGATEMPAQEMLFTSYEIAGATLVPVPAFAECRPFELEGMDTPTALTASAVRTSGWSGMAFAPLDHPWDGDAAAARIAADCGIGGDNPDWDCYASGFLYRDTEADPNTQGAYSWPLVDVIDGERVIVPRAVYAAANILSGGRGGTNIPAAKQTTMRGVVAKLYKRMAKHFDDPSIVAPWADDSGKMALLASAALGMPSEELFRDPELDRLTPLTRRPLGNGWVHVFGHIAEHSTCLVGMRHVCLTPPYSEREYSSFHRYHQTPDGSVRFPLPLGRLTAGFGSLENACRCCPGNDDHACANISFGAAVAHHDQMQVLSYGRVGEDEKNNAIWYSGIEAPGVDERGQRLLNRKKISGDWREVAGSMELSEILVLNRRNPGFPLPRVSMEGGRQRALTAAGVIHAPVADQRITVPQEPDAPHDPIDYERLGAAVAGALMAAASGGDADGELAFNKGQRRGPDGRWIKGGGVGVPSGGDTRGGAGAGGRRDSSEERTAAAGARRLRVKQGEVDALRDALRARDTPESNRAADTLDGFRPGEGVMLTPSEQDLLMEETAKLGEPDARNFDDEGIDSAINKVTAQVGEAQRERRQRETGEPAVKLPPEPVRTEAEQERHEYNEEIVDEALGFQQENDDDDPDDELDAQIDLVVELMNANSPEADAAVDRLRQMLEISYADSDELPTPPARAVTAAAEVHSGAMLALRMTEQDAARLAVTDGEPMEQLHLTLAYLGNASDIPPEVREKIEAEGRELAASLSGPVTGDGFSVNTFNPGNANDRDTALVLGVGGDELADIHRRVSEMNMGGHEMPQQYSPWAPHVTLQYTDDLDRVKAMADRVGPVTFDRLRMAFGGDVVDIPLGGVSVGAGGYDISAEMASRAQAAMATVRAQRALMKLNQI